MKISYYELLGMIKENKQPKKVVYNDFVYIWNDINYEKSNGYHITDRLDEKDMFNKEIFILESTEIIEEEKEIEELKPKLECVRDGLKPIPYERKYYNIEELGDKLNELIREVNKLKKEGK